MGVGVNTTRDRSESARPLVLVVDADALLRWAMREAVGAAGFAVGEVSTALDARTALADGSAPAVAIVDPHFPDASSAEVLDAMRALAPECRLLVMLADDTPASRATALQFGAAAVLAKPVDLDDVVTRVRVLAGL